MNKDQSIKIFNIFSYLPLILVAMFYSYILRFYIWNNYKLPYEHYLEPADCPFVFHNIFTLLLYTFCNVFAIPYVCLYLIYLTFTGDFHKLNKKQMGAIVVGIGLYYFMTMIDPNGLFFWFYDS